MRNIFLRIFFKRTLMEEKIEIMDADELRDTISYSPIIETKKDSVTLKALFSYKDPYAREFIKGIKYKGKNIKPAAELVHEEIIELIAELNLFSSFHYPLLIPIPLSKNRKKERGFNQIEQITDAIMKIDNNKSFEIRSDVLVKIKETENQTNLDRKKRLRNLKGAFKVTDKKLIKGRNIIVLDDVITTGTTLQQASKILLKAGARKVIGFALAH